MTFLPKPALFFSSLAFIIKITADISNSDIMIAKVNCSLADVLPPASRDTVDLPRSPHHPDAEIGHIMAPCLYLRIPQPPWVLASPHPQYLSEAQEWLEAGGVGQSCPAFF